MFIASTVAFILFAMKFIDFNNIEKIIIKHNKLGIESVKQEAIISTGIFFSIENYNSGNLMIYTNFQCFIKYESI